jgi:hypothetical protein
MLETEKEGALGAKEEGRNIPLNATLRAILKSESQMMEEFMSRRRTQREFRTSLYLLCFFCVLTQCTSMLRLHFVSVSRMVEEFIVHAEREVA